MAWAGAWGTSSPRAPPTWELTAPRHHPPTTGEGAIVRNAATPACLPSGLWGQVRVRVSGRGCPGCIPGNSGQTAGLLGGEDRRPGPAAVSGGSWEGGPGVPAARGRWVALEGGREGREWQLPSVSVPGPAPGHRG